MPELQRILFILGCVAFGAGIVLLLIGFVVAAGDLGKTTQTHEIDETVLVPAGSEYKYVPMPVEICISSFFQGAEDIRIEGAALEVNNLDFNFYLLINLSKIKIVSSQLDLSIE